MNGHCSRDRSLPRVRAYADLTKPRITLMTLFSTATGYVITRSEAWRVTGLMVTLVATGLLAAGAAVLNQWYERDTDALMRRTRRRPIPSGRVTPSAALWFGIALSSIGVTGLAALVNPAAATAGFITLASYVSVYTPLKRRSASGVFVGAFAGAMPPVIGSIAAAASLEWPAIALFALLFVWQVPHVYAIALMHRDDYAMGGLRMLPASAGDREVAGQILGWSVLVLLAGLVPAYSGAVGPGYALFAAAAGLWVVARSVRVWIDPSRRHARQVLLASIVYLPSLFLVAIADSSWTRALHVVRG
jgi:protoheme IX farnesyltransferase